MDFNFSAIGRITSQILIILGIAMIPSLGIALFCGESATTTCFLLLVLLLPAAGFCGVKKIKLRSSNLKTKDGLLVVALVWILASLIGSLPYIMSGVLPHFPDAIFESTSALTTTGASIIEDVESIPKSLLFWRSLSQWLGGMGILVFVISILPALGISGQRILRAETPGPYLDKLASKMTDSAKMLYLIYLSFTLLAIFLLKVGGLSLFDSMIAAFGCVAAGGLSNYSAGIAHFNSGYVELISVIFTLFAAINYTLYNRLLQRQWKDFFRDRELRTFLLIVATATLLISGDLYFSHTYESGFLALQDGFFQTTSFITTTGHYNTDFNIWPTFSKLLLFILMCMGGCSASTCSGLKVIRVMVFFSVIRRSLEKRVHPRAVIPVKIGDQVIPSERVSGIVYFFITYIFVFSVSLLVLAFENMDLTTTMTAVAATLNNVGTGFELVGPSGSFLGFSAFSKIYLCFLMLAGRLEFYAVLLLFTPSFWMRAK